MYFEHQEGHNCVVHAWNNARGRKEVSRKILEKAMETMLLSHPVRNRGWIRRQYIGRAGISPDVLHHWVNKVAVDLGLRMTMVPKFRSLSGLRDLWLTHNPQFLLVSLRVGEAYSHTVSIRYEPSSGRRKTFVVLDSELPEPLNIGDHRRSFRAYFRHRTVTGAFIVKRKAEKQQPLPTPELIDLADSDDDNNSDGSEVDFWSESDDPGSSSDDFSQSDSGGSGQQ